MATIVKDNRELLYDKALTLGYTGDPNATAAELLWWISNRLNNTDVDEQNDSVIKRVTELETFKTDSLAKGSFVGVFDSTIARDANQLGKEKTGDTALIMDSGGRAYMTVYSNNGWYEETAPRVLMGVGDPPALTADFAGTIYFETDSQTFYVRDKQHWMVEKKIAVVGNYALSIEGGN